MYDTAEYANSRLMNTIVMLKRKPVIVHRVKDDMSVLVWPCVDRHKVLDVRLKSVPLTSLNLLDFRLGFLNKDGNTSYLFRRTLRRDYMQGLHAGNVGSTEFQIDALDIARVLLHRYPSFNKANSTVTEGRANSMAWCEDFCIKQGGVVGWKQYDVGSLEGDTLHLLDKFSFLKDLLVEKTNGCIRVF